MYRLLSNLFRSFRLAPSKTSRTAQRAHLQLEGLEDRQVPATLTLGSTVPAISLQPIVQRTLSGDLNIYSTSAAVKAQVDLISVNGVATYEVQLNGSSSRFAASSVTGGLYFHGAERNDFLANNTSLRTIAYGGGGDDTLIGGYSEDQLFGEGDNDTIYGREGNDFLDGGSGNDLVNGGEGIDNVYGSDGNDTLRGEGGNDWLYGEAGNDVLYGGTGTDTLYGGNGNDGLFGGAGTNWLLGQGGADRFLLWGNDTVLDNEASDARVRFTDSAAQSVSLTGLTGPGQAPFMFAAGTWTEAEIEKIDVALGNLHSHTGNTRLLKKADGGEMTYERIGTQINRPDFTTWGWNTGTKVTFTNASFSTDIGLWETVYHEMGHNWDEPGENSRIGAFRQISDWRQAPMAPNVNYVASTGTGDDWWHLNTASFARGYGMTNPLEDYATTWETYFLNAYHGTTNGNTIVTAKTANLDLLFADLRLLS